MDLKWKEDILACFKKFCDNVPKAFVEAKEYPFSPLLYLFLLISFPLLFIFFFSYVLRAVGVYNIYDYFGDMP